MKKVFIFHVAVAALLLLAVNLHSQTAVQKSPVDQLKALKLKNADIIQKQRAALQRLEEMEKQADQIRILGRRS